MEITVTEKDILTAEHNCAAAQTLSQIGRPNVKRYFYNEIIKLKHDQSVKILRLSDKSRGYIIEQSTFKSCVLNKLKRYKCVSPLVYNIIKFKYEQGNENVIINVGKCGEDVVLLFNDRITYVMPQKDYNSSFRELRPFINIEKTSNCEWLYVKLEPCSAMNMSFSDGDIAKTAVSNSTLKHRDSRIETDIGCGEYVYKLNEPRSSDKICTSIYTIIENLAAQDPSIAGELLIYVSKNNLSWTYADSINQS